MILTITTFSARVTDSCKVFSLSILLPMMTTPRKNDPVVWEAQESELHMRELIDKQAAIAMAVWTALDFMQFDHEKGIVLAATLNDSLKNICSTDEEEIYMRGFEDGQRVLRERFDAVMKEMREDDE